MLNKDYSLLWTGIIFCMLKHVRNRKKQDLQYYYRLADVDLKNLSEFIDYNLNYYQTKY